MAAKIMHGLKITPEYFAMQLRGEKRFEIRRNDRAYKAGDFLWLEEVVEGVFTGRALLVEVTCVCDFMQRDGFVVLGTSNPLKVQAK